MTEQTASGMETPTPVGPNTQELRLATAMTGGVSLAVWMGGVTREMNLLQQAAWWRASGKPAQVSSHGDDRTRALYLRLLNLMDTSISIDILSGTSAGGINAALLGLARANSWDLAHLRDFWLESGGLETLLRDPSSEKQPPSLLQGDGVLYRELVRRINALANSPTPTPTDGSPDQHRTQVFITTTLLTGETGRFTDSYGTQVQDQDHRGIFVFNEDSLNATEAVALAARSSASFPAAFEPAYLPYNDEIHGSENGLEYPKMKEYANITRPHWAADGGLLANRPIKPVLQAIFDRPADRQVRRVLLYVVPSPGNAPDLRDTPTPEDFAKPWTLGEALLKDLGAALNQSISAELTALRDHNDRMDALRDTRLRMAELGAMIPRDQFLTRAMRDDYLLREGTRLARPVIASLMRALTTSAAETWPATWHLALAPGCDAERVLRDNAVEGVTVGWDFPRPATPSTADRELFKMLAAFGLGPFEGAKATVLAMLRAAYTCQPERGTREMLARLVNGVHTARVPRTRQHVADGVEQAMRAGQEQGLELKDVVVNAVKEAYPEEPSLADGWRQLAGLIVQLSRLSPLSPRTVQEQRHQAAAELHTYLGYLIPRPRSLGRIALALFNLHVATRSVLPVGIDVEQPVELVQVSADTRCALDPKRATAAQKLTGLQLHHFGAFYKSAWRANDWTWGRLDGAGWLVHLLLDPRRVLTVVEDAEVPRGCRRDWFYGRLRELLLDPTGSAGRTNNPLDEESTKKAICTELSYLDDVNVPLPSSLPVTSMWVTQCWHQCIIEVELPIIAREMLSTPSAKGNQWATDVLNAAGSPTRAEAASRTAVSAVITGRWSEEQKKLIDSELQRDAGTTGQADSARLALLLASCPVPDEKFAGEIGQPLFSRTLGKAIAVTAAAVSGLAKPAAPLRPVLSSVRTITLAGFRASVLTGGQARTLILSGLITFLVGVLAMTQHFALLGVTGLVLALIGGYLFALGTWAHWRKVVPAAGAISVVVAVFFILSPVGRRALFGSGDCNTRCSHQDIGVVGRNVLPWLRAPWWHSLTALCLILAGVLVLSRLSSRPQGRKHRSGEDPGKTPRNTSVESGTQQGETDSPTQVTRTTDGSTTPTAPSPHEAPGQPPHSAG